MLLGIIWAVAAPLLLVPVAWPVYRALARTGWARRARAAAAAAIVLVPTGWIAWQDYRDFRKLCETLGRPKIFARALADGLYLDSPTAGSFGTRYLHDQGFAWIEIRSNVDRSRFERLHHTPGQAIRIETMDAPSARHEVRETSERPNPHASVQQTRVIDRQTGALLASAARVHFDGGRLNWVMGVYGARSCPSALSDSEDFRTYDRLAQLTLRPPATLR